ncbi:hypothetical protein EX30DRAFT_241742 [Ascodesmis nigricans]|uniref:Uncharacterized protein n=1 Tax=Ascodesmis nigricans TaxID=341454 RepID=A0A4V3SIZ7_9PEZI|nr:hypothetical protein EX30DRAFT_241742 [Ascodesmis nigricans]
MRKRGCRNPRLSVYSQPTRQLWLATESISTANASSRPSPHPVSILSLSLSLSLHLPPSPLHLSQRHHPRPGAVSVQLPHHHPTTASLCTPQHTTSRVRERSTPTGRVIAPETRCPTSDHTSICSNESQGWKVEKARAGQQLEVPTIRIWARIIRKSAG